MRNTQVVGKKTEGGALSRAARKACRLAAVCLLQAAMAPAAFCGHPDGVSFRLEDDGSLAFAGGRVFIAAFHPGWATSKVAADAAMAEEDAAHILGPDAGCPFTVANRAGDVHFRGRAAWKVRDDGAICGNVRVECETNVTMQCLALSVGYPAEPPAGLGSTTAREVTVPLGDGRSLLFSFDRPQRCYTQDSRPWGGGWETRFGDLRQSQDFAAGDLVEWNVVITGAPGTPLAISDGEPVEILPGDRWIPLVWHKDVEPGSALDFSGMGFQDAPAGKHGWLRAAGGQFEFEGLPGVPQRFYGVNLCFSANYPDHDLADILVERFVRCGYNAVRIHHHDGAWEGDLVDRLDYLLARCFERGIYATTDLYVSRKVPWRDIGIERDGNVDVQLYKTLVGIYDPAFEDWCRWAEAFLHHVNPYTGRAYLDEPGMPLISLVNEGKLGMGYAAKAADPRVLAAWREFSGEADIPIPSGSGAPHFDEFEEWVNRRTFERCAAFVRSLGCRALLTNDNNGSRHGEGQGCTPLYDYVDSHFYVDHPGFIKEPWKLPSRCGNLNPVRAGNPALLHRGYAKDASKPHVVSEWNFSGPGRYRGVGGILTGALAAQDGWDGLWRFAYSHSNANLVDGKGNMGYFDCVTDPLVSASDRAAVCLFLGEWSRADLLETPVVLDRERGSMALATPLLCGGFAESGRIEAGPLSFEIVAPGQDPAHKTTANAGLEPEAKSTGNVPATLWASSLDGAPLAESSRILLVHLADVQGKYARYADETRQVLLKWGAGTLIEASAAEVALAVSGEARNPPPAVFALDTAGRRVAELPSAFDPASGIIRFRADTRGPDGNGCIFYEIANPAVIKGE